ncbi:MAG: hypothetical protein KF784_04480 [Fimbriimonadaceae bacterium]|nr:hypothetical protein [Fimbriimonadaceae bacterium]
MQTVEFYGGKNTLGFLEWQCRLAAIVGGVCFFLIGLFLRSTSRDLLTVPSDQTTGYSTTNILTLMPILGYYVDFFAWILPWAFMVGAFTLYRRYSGLRRILVAAIIMAFGIHQIIHNRGYGSIALLTGALWSLYGLYDWLSATPDQLRKWCILLLASARERLELRA